MQTETKNPLIYQLLKIRIYNPLFILFIYPPIYALWLYAIGKFILEREGKENKIFNLFARTMIVVVTFWSFVAPLLYLLLNIDLFSVDNELYKAFMAFSIYISWFGTIGIISKISIDYERLLDPEESNTLVKFKSYYTRFFLLFWWYVGIWFIQLKVNKYLIAQTANNKVN